MVASGAAGKDGAGADRDKADAEAASTNDSVADSSYTSVASGSGDASSSADGSSCSASVVAQDIAGADRDFAAALADVRATVAATSSDAPRKRALSPLPPSSPMQSRAAAVSLASLRQPKPFDVLARLAANHAVRGRRLAGADDGFEDLDSFRLRGSAQPRAATSARGGRAGASASRLGGIAEADVEDLLARWRLPASPSASAAAASDSVAGQPIAPRSSSAQREASSPSGSSQSYGAESFEAPGSRGKSSRSPSPSGSGSSQRSYGSQGFEAASPSASQSSSHSSSRSSSSR
eukprot:TRINITY_DN30103_c0_g1_i1.p1 TRINITY_DN30103_c0_g1~~TRINITY_DN30103_c0_g1_i1.p1  ORF type:complete len:293 (-),score=62.08 TRINITY_DN30103_c0_g1_i1:109-987(-)